ncbi:carbonic anhydrase [Rhodocyclaceae bacterium SMB388]
MKTFASAAMLILLTGATDLAAQDSWETLMRDRNRQVQIDRASIIQADAGTRVAWARVVLMPAEAATAGYMTAQALNRFDCVNRSFITVRRRYLDARNIVVREESIADPKPVLVSSNTVDERLWREICRPPSVADLQRIADDPARRPVSPSRPQVQAEPAPVRDASPSPAARTPAVPVDARPAAAAPATRSARAPSDPSRLTPSVPLPAAAATPPMVEWSYHGETGPAHWGRLRPDWALCDSGMRQSPVDLRDGIAVDLEPVSFDYRQTRFMVTDTGRTLEVMVGAGLGADIRGRRFELERIRFHSPSEMRIDGQVHELGLHLHHRDADGRHAIVAISIDGGGTPHPVIQALWNSLPLDRGAYFMPQATIDIAALLPGSQAHYLYLGSLSTPPCSEGVTWVVLKEPVRISDDQLGIFRRLYANNGRPVQPLNDRIVLQSR